MRILGFTKKWNKLRQAEFTTFRFPRKDKDWEVGEQVQIVYKPRSKQREMLGIAKIIRKERRCMAWQRSRLTLPKVTNNEAIADGFGDYLFMWQCLCSLYGIDKLLDQPMNKLTLKMANTASLFSERSTLPNTTKGGEHYRGDYLKA